MPPKKATHRANDERGRPVRPGSLPGTPRRATRPARSGEGHETDARARGQPHKSLAREIGERLRELRTAPRGASRTQGEVARTAGISVSFLSMIERGERSASLESLQQIAAALGCSLSDLFARDRGAPEVHRLLTASRRRRPLTPKQVDRLLAVAKAMFED